MHDWQVFIMIFSEYLEAMSKIIEHYGGTVGEQRLHHNIKKSKHGDFVLCKHEE